MIEYNQAESGEIPTDADVGVKVIGVGGAGANVLDRMALEGSDDAELLTLNTDVRALTTSVSSDKIQLGSTLLKGMGTGGDPSLGKQAAIEAVDEIRDAVRGCGMVFLCVGLGGGTGSGAAPEVARIVREEGGFLVVFATMPFSFEGERRGGQAEAALARIGQYANALITFDNDRMGELIVPKDGVTQAFAAADKIISQSIRATMNVVFRPGIIRIGMDDLLAALDAADSRCLFGYGIAKGDNRSLEAIEQALKCPLLDRGKLLNEAQAVLVQVAGGDTMTLYEVQLVMEEVSKHVGSETQILFGTGTDKRLSNSLSVTIISSVAGPEPAAAEPADEPESATGPSVSLGMPEMTAPNSPLAESVQAAEEDNGEEDATLDLGSEAPPYLLQDLEEEEEAKPEGSVIFEPLDTDDAAVEEAEAEVPSYSPQSVPSARVEAVPPSLDESDEQDDEPADMKNPIAAAVEGAAIDDDDSADDVKPILPAAAGESADEDDSEESGAGHVEAVTETEQKITLTRMVSSGNTGRIKTRPPGEDSGEGPVLPPTKAPALPQETLDPSDEPSEEARQQQEMLQLEPAKGKGRFAKTDPTIVDGEDLDVPTFLRKKK